MTQYQAILNYLRKHRCATVRDLLKFTNYPSARIFEMERAWLDGGHANFIGQVSEKDIITRTWVQRNGKKVRLYMLTKA
jgi:hypothetical protein